MNKFTFVREKNDRQNLWYMAPDIWVLSSTDMAGSEVMLFNSDPNGQVQDWLDLYVSYENIDDHAWHMAEYSKELK